MSFQLTLPDLEERFLPPPNWQIKDFINPKTNHNIFYRFAFIDKPKAIIFCLPGLSEYGEKYIETTRFLNNQGYNVVIIDWAYQGLSTRLKDNKHKRHSDGYDMDISDLHHLIALEIKSDLPHYIMAHSMGANIALRYILKHPNRIKAIATSAAMININNLKYIGGLICMVFSIVKPLHKKYIIGGTDWHEEDRTVKSKKIFTSDPIRTKIHNAWCLTNPDLQIGKPTYKWLVESLKSICTLKSKTTLQKIQCPVLLAYAGKEKLVDNDAIVRAAKYLPNDHLIYFETAKHEILMETDDIRDVFLKQALKLFNQ